MADNEANSSSLSTSRRTLLKGAVGAGVGLAAWSAPKIGTIPAYALTNSTGVFDGVCYYFLWNANAGQKRWGRGQNLVSPGNATGYADSITNVPSTNSDFTWLDVFPGGGDLVVNANGNPEGGGTATITLTTTNPGCVFELPGLTTFANQPPNPPGFGSDPASCISGNSSNGGTITPMGGSTFTLTGVAATGRSYIIFNINCD